MKKINIAGEVYGRLTVIEEVEQDISISNKKIRKWKCQCECGNKVITRQVSLRSGNTKSCGCLRKEITKETKTKHGHSSNRSNSKEYSCWLGIKARCFNPNDTAYHNYGGRGITMYFEWKDDFEAFYKYMGDAPSPNHSIDRINENGNYEPGNVEWGTNQTQAIRRRTRKDNTSGIKGVKWNKKDKKWIAYIGVNHKLIHLGSFNTKKEALVARLEAEEKYHKPLLKVI